jgi:hypothetical protein
VGEEVKNTTIKIEGGVDPKTIRDLNESLKLLAQMNKEQTSSAKEMAQSVKDMTQYLGAMAGAADFGNRRFRTMQETLMNIVDGLDDYQDQAKGIIRIQKQFTATPELLLGKNKDDALRFLDQFIRKTKELQKCRDLDAKTLRVLDKELKSTELLYRRVQEAQGDAFDPKIVDELTSALQDASQSADRLRKNFENTDTNKLLQGVSRVKKALDETTGGRFTKFFMEGPLGKHIEGMQQKFGQGARQERKDQRARASQKWDDWKEARAARKATQPDHFKPPQAAPASRFAGRKFRESTASRSHLVPPLSVRSSPVATNVASHAVAASGGSTKETPTTLTIEHAEIKQATITALTGDVGGGAPSEKATGSQQQIQGAETPNAGETTAAAEDDDTGAKGKKGKKGKRPPKQQTRKQKKSAQRLAAKAAKGGGSGAVGATAEILTDGGAGDPAAAGSDLLGSGDRFAGRKRITLGKEVKSRLIGKAVSSLAGKAASSAGEALAASGGAAAAGAAGGGLLSGAVAVGSKVAGFLAAPIAIASAVLDISDMIKNQNKELDAKLTGGGISANGIDYTNVRSSLMSSGVSNAMSRGIGYKDNLETMQMIAAGGHGIGFLNNEKGSPGRINLESALMTRREAEIGRDQFKGGGILGKFSAATRFLTGGNSAKADEGDQDKRMRDASGFIGAMMKNANFYGRNVGLDKGDSIKLTTELLEKYKLTTEGTSEFFIKIDKAMKTAQISSSKYIEIVESLNSGFSDFNNTMRLTTNLVDILGRNARYTGDRMKSMAGELFKGPQQDIAHRAFTAAQSMADPGTRQSTIEMYEATAKKAKDDLLEQAGDLSKFFDSDRNGVKKDENGRIVDITDMRQFEARIAELARPGAKEGVEAGTLKVLQNQVTKYAEEASFSKTQIKNIRDNNAVGLAATAENRGNTPESALSSNIDFIQSLKRNAKGTKLQDLISMDVDTRSEAMGKNPLLLGTLAKELGKPMEEVRKLLDALGGTSKQVQDLITDKLGKVSDEGTVANTDDVSIRQQQAIADMGRKLAREGAAGMAGIKDSSTNAEVLKVMKRMAADPKGNKLVEAMQDTDSSITDLAGPLGVLVDEAKKKEEFDKGKAKSDVNTANLRTQADIAASAQAYLFDKVVNALDELGKIINPDNWEAARNKTGRWAANPEDDAKVLANARGDAIRQAGGQYIANANTVGMTEADKAALEVVRTASTKHGEFTVDEADKFNKAVKALKEYATTHQKTGLDPKEADSIYGAADEKEMQMRSDAANVARAQRMEREAKVGKEKRDKLIRGDLTPEAITDAYTKAEDGEVSRPYQAALQRWRHSEAMKGKTDDQIKHAYGVSIAVGGALEQGLDKNKYSGSEIGEAEDIVKSRLSEAHMKEFFGEGKDGAYSFKAGSIQDDYMNQFMTDLQAKGLLAGAKRVEDGKGGVTYNLYNTNPTAVIPAGKAATNSTPTEGATSTDPKPSAAAPAPKAST